MRSRLLQHVFYLLQKIAYGAAHHITVISEDMRDRVEEQGVQTQKVTVIPNWYDDTTVREVRWEDNRFVQSERLDHRQFYVQYAGTMGYVFDYDMVLRVAELLKPRTDITFQMIGSGSQRPEFEAEARDRGLTNIVFHPLQPQDLVSDVYSAASVCLIPLKRGVIGNSVPSKIALVMACGRTIVNSVDEDSKYFAMFNEMGIGLSASNQDPRAVAEAIVKMREDEAAKRTMEANALAFSASVYSRSQNTATLLALLRELSVERAPATLGPRTAEGHES